MAYDISHCRWKTLFDFKMQLPHNIESCPEQHRTTSVPLCTTSVRLPYNSVQVPYIEIAIFQNFLDLGLGNHIGLGCHQNSQMIQQTSAKIRKWAKVRRFLHSKTHYFGFPNKSLNHTDTIWNPVNLDHAIWNRPIPREKLENWASSNPWESLPFWNFSLRVKLTSRFLNISQKHCLSLELGLLFIWSDMNNLN